MTRKKGLGQRLSWLLLVLLFVAGCGKESSGDESVVLAANPPSVVRGESVVISVTAAEAFFEGDIDEQLSGDGSSIVESIDVVDSTHAQFIISTDGSTPLGILELVYSNGDRQAVLKMGVVPGEAGPGTAFADDALATAGAAHAELKIFGQGTNFDSDVEIFVKDADLLEIHTINIHNAGYIALTYSIGLEQVPANATIMIIDGFFEYEIPFTIVSPTDYENHVAGQVLTRGRWNYLHLQNSEATLLGRTTLDLSDLGFEVASTQYLEEGHVVVPVLVPEDADQETHMLTAFTHSNQGAMLETMNVEFSIIAPQYLMVEPANVSSQECPSQIIISVEGGDTSQIEQLESSEEIQIINWLSLNETQLSVDVCVTPNSEGESILFTGTGPSFEGSGLAVVTGSDRDAYVNPTTVYNSEVIDAAVVVTGGVLVEGDVDIIGPSEIQVLNFHYVDDTSILISLSVNETANSGSYLIEISSGGNNFYADLTIDYP